MTGTGIDTGPRFSGSAGRCASRGWWAADGNTMVVYGNAACRVALLHNDGADVGFCDRHRKWEKGENWKPSMWNPGWTP